MPAGGVTGPAEDGALLGAESFDPKGHIAEDGLRFSITLMPASSADSSKDLTSDPAAAEKGWDETWVHPSSVHHAWRKV